MLPVLYFRFALKGKRDMQALHRKTQSTDRTWVFLTVWTKLVSCIALKDMLQRLHGKCQRKPMLQVFSSFPQPRNWLSHIDKWDMWPHLSYLWLELMFYLRRLLSAGQVCGMADIDRLHVLLYLMHHSLPTATNKLWSERQNDRLQPKGLESRPGCWILQVLSLACLIFTTRSFG